MKRGNITGKIVAKVMILALAAAALSGCGNTKKAATDSDAATGSDSAAFDSEASKTKIMVVGDFDIYLDEALVYAFQNIHLRGDAPEDWSEAKEEAVKKEVLSSIRETKILYNVANFNEYTLEESDLAVVEQTSNNFKENFGLDLLAKYGISDETVTRVFEEQALVSKFETQIRGEMGQSIYDDFSAEYEDYQFNSIYAMLFPTVEKDANDEPAFDEAGNYVYLSEEEKADVRAQAEEALEKLRNGSDYQELADEYGVSNYSSETNGFISSDDSSYSDEMTEVISGLENGECSEILETTLGYQIIYMISTDDENLRDSYVYMLANERLQDEYATLRNNWLNTIEIHEEGDMEGTVWEDYSLSPIVEDIYELKSE